MEIVSHIVTFSIGCICTVLLVFDFKAAAVEKDKAERQADHDDYPHEHIGGSDAKD